MTPVAKPLLFGAATIFCYLAVVVLTTPALPPDAAVSAAFALNHTVIAGMGAGIGLQVYLAERSRLYGCKLNAKRKALGGNSASATAASFFSFFSLVPLGCCGWWLYVLSLLPSILGTGISAALIQYSQPLAYLGLAAVFAFNGITFLKLRREMRARKSHDPTVRLDKA